MFVRYFCICIGVWAFAASAPAFTVLDASAILKLELSGQRSACGMFCLESQDCVRVLAGETEDRPVDASLAQSEELDTPFGDFGGRILANFERRIDASGLGLRAELDWTLWDRFLGVIHVQDELDFELTERRYMRLELRERVWFGRSSAGAEQPAPEDDGDYTPRDGLTDLVLSHEDGAAIFAASYETDPYDGSHYLPPDQRDWEGAAEGWLEPGRYRVSFRVEHPAMGGNPVSLSAWLRRFVIRVDLELRLSTSPVSTNDQSFGALKSEFD